MAVNLAQDSASVGLPAQDEQTLRRVFSEVASDSCPTRFNFHIHTLFSDGRLHPHQVIDQAIAIGLRGFAITDHHSIGGFQAAQHYLESLLVTARSPRHALRLWTGVEINAGLLDVEVHILGYAFDPSHEAMQPYLQGCAATGGDYAAQSVIQALHHAGGVAVLAHPARYKCSHYQLVPAAAELGIDAVETFYAYTNPNPWHPSAQQTEEVQQLAVKHNLLSTCGTDTHGTNLLQRL